MHTQILCFVLELATGWGFLFCLCLLSFVLFSPRLELTYPYSHFIGTLILGKMVQKPDGHCVQSPVTYTGEEENQPPEVVL